MVAIINRDLESELAAILEEAYGSSACLRRAKAHRAPRSKPEGGGGPAQVVSIREDRPRRAERARAPRSLEPFERRPFDAEATRLRSLEAMGW